MERGQGAAGRTARRAARAAPPRASAGRRTVLLRVTYCREYLRCDAPGCRVCADGAGHGPYWRRCGQVVLGYA